MSYRLEDITLDLEEKLLACGHWDALMFAASRLELEKARLALINAPPLVQRAVMSSITQYWMDEYEPRREENPFLVIPNDGPDLTSSLPEPEPEKEFSVPVADGDAGTPDAVPEPRPRHSLAFRTRQLLRALERLSVGSNRASLQSSPLHRTTNSHG